MASQKAKPLKLTPEQRVNVIENLLKRVDNPQRRAQIQALALTLSDDGSNEDVYYSTLYHYQLKENWSKIVPDYNEFCTPGMYQGESDDYGSAEAPQKAAVTPKSTRKTRPIRKRKGPRG